MIPHRQPVVHQACLNSCLLPHPTALAGPIPKHQTRNTKQVGDRLGRVALHVRQHMLDRLVEDLQLGVCDDVEGRGEGGGLLLDLPPPAHEARQGASVLLLILPFTCSSRFVWSV